MSECKVGTHVFAEEICPHCGFTLQDALNQAETRITELEQEREEWKGTALSLKRELNDKTVWALMKDGQKRAVKIFQNQDDIPDVGKSYYIEERKGIDVRCVDYCNVNQWCEYYRNVYGQQN